MAPDKAVRTAQQMAVLCIISEMNPITMQAHVQDAQPHQEAQPHFGAYPDLEISKEDCRKCRKYEIGNDGKDCGVDGQYAKFACYMRGGPTYCLAQRQRIRLDDSTDTLRRRPRPSML